MNSVICFGEMLLRFSPLPNEESFVQNQMPVFVGGAELNVAQALANWQVAVGYCSAAPDNFLTENILSFLDTKKIDTSSIHKGGNRLGIYYLQQGTDVKNDGVVFDRVNSSFASLTIGDINWQNVLKNKGWFHFSAIAASLSQSTADVCLEAIAVAKKMGLKVSIDLNFRSKLWKYGKQPQEIMRSLLPYCDVVMGNIWSVEALLGSPSPIATSENKTEKELEAAALHSFAILKKLYPNIQQIAYTFRLPNTYFAFLYDSDNTYKSKTHFLQNVVDKVGSGDCFMAGLIFGNINSLTSQQIIDFSASAAVGKLFEKGDSTQQTIAQIQARY
jgi:2-dehydro-3-deoxygluconokinase